MTEPQTLIREPIDPVRTTTNGRPPAVEPCQECGAPMERQQRYCVECAARRSDVANPASRYFAAASRQRRRNATAQTAEGPAGSLPGSTRAAAVFFFALLPIAVAIGVLVGQGGSGSSDEELLAALRDGSGGTAVAADGSGTSAETVSNDQLLASDFALDEGFTVMIGSLPIDGTDEAAADEAKAAAEADGAEDVGLINPGDFATAPDQGQQDYILYSGEFKSRGDAEKALSGLKKSFPDAAVIEVTAAGAGGGGSASSGGAGDDLNQNRVVAQTSHGEVHEVTAEPPSEEQVQRDTEIVNDIANQTGEDYTDLQETLPDVVVVGGDPDDAPPLPTGAGD